MANKIIDIDPEKRATKEALEQFKVLIASLDASKLKQAFFYLDTDEGPSMSVYGPDWQLTGRLKEFLNEINLELYLSDFGDHRLQLSGEEEEE